MSEIKICSIISSIKKYIKQQIIEELINKSL